MDDFSKHPKSVTELRCDKTQKAEDQKPRDVLVRMLRQIDSGEINPNALVVAWQSENQSGWEQSSSDISIAIGLCSIAQTRMTLAAGGG